MAKYIKIHPVTPEKRLISEVAAQLKSGAVIAYPTSSGYALGCAITNRDGQERIRRIRKLPEKHDFTLLCADISAASVYAKIDNRVFNMIKRSDAGKFTYILKTTSELPKKAHSKRSTVGIRIASHIFVRELLQEFGEPILSTSLLIPTDGDDEGAEVEVFTDSWSVKEALDNDVDIVIEAGDVGLDPTTVVDLTDGEVILRQGAGIL